MKLDFSILRLPKGKSLPLETKAEQNLSKQKMSLLFQKVPGYGISSFSAVITSVSWLEAKVPPAIPYQKEVPVQTRLKWLLQG